MRLRQVVTFFLGRRWRIVVYRARRITEGSDYALELPCRRCGQGPQSLLFNDTTKAAVFPANINYSPLHLLRMSFHDRQSRTESKNCG